MTTSKITVRGLALVAVAALTANAQPAPNPTPEPAPDTKPAGKPDVKNEKAGNESLQNGGDTRPWAAGVPADKQRAALEKFREGNARLNDGLFADAVKRYREALASWDHPAIHYNLALALLNLDQPIEVHDSLQKATRFGEAPLEKEKFDHAQKYLKLVEQQIAAVEVTCKKPGAKISVDGKEVFTVDATGGGGHFKGRVRIGKHTFVAEKPGYNAEVEAPFIGPGETYRIELRLYTAEELTRYRRKWDATWMPYAVLGGGVVLGLVSGLLSVSAQSSYDEFDSAVTQCNADNNMMGCVDPSVMELRDSGDSKKTMSYVTLGIAGGAVLTGAVMAYLNRREAYQITADDYRREEREKAKRAGSVSFSPMIAPGTGGAIVSGSF